MTFDVKTRNAKGGIEYIRIEAEDRSALFAELKTRGVSAICVEVANGKAKSRKVKPAGVAGNGNPVSGVVKGLLALVAVCVVGAVVWLCVSKDEPEAVSEVKSEKPKRMTEVVAVPPVSFKDDVVKEQPSSCDSTVSVSPTNLPFGRLDDGRWNLPERKKIHNVVTNFSNVSTSVAYRNGTEQALLMVFSKRLGDMPSVMPNINKKDREHLLEILLEKAEITADDEEWMREDKETINLAKDALSDYLKNGGDVDSFFEYYHNELIRAYDTRKVAVQSVFKFAQESDPDLAVQYCEEVNKMLEEKGIRPVALPAKLIERKR